MRSLQFPDPATLFDPVLVKSLDSFLGDGKGKLYLRILGSNGAGKSAFGRALRGSNPDAFSFTGLRFAP